MASQKGYGSSARDYNAQYMPKGMGGDLGQASKPKIVTVPCGNGWSEVVAYKPGNMGYPSQAFDYNY